MLVAALDTATLTLSCALVDLGPDPGAPVRVRCERTERAAHGKPGRGAPVGHGGRLPGALGDLLYRAADAMDEETNARLSRLLSLLEPLIILVMGTVVAFIVVSVLLPLLDISQIVR